MWCAGRNTLPVLVPFVAGTTKQPITCWDRVQARGRLCILHAMLLSHATSAMRGSMLLRLGLCVYYTTNRGRNQYLLRLSLRNKMTEGEALQASALKHNRKLRRGPGDRGRFARCTRPVSIYARKLTAVYLIDSTAAAIGEWFSARLG